MGKIDELKNSAHIIKTNELPNSNTATLIGGHLEQINEVLEDLNKNNGDYNVLDRKVSKLEQKVGNVSSLQFDQANNTITINGVKFDLVKHNDSPTPSEPTEPEYDYYVGQVDGSKSVFAAMTENDLVANSAKQTSSLVNTTNVNKWIYFFMIPSGYNFASLEFTDGGIKTTVTDLADFTATHDDVTIGGKVYKVYGYRVSPNALDYKLVLTK